MLVQSTIDRTPTGRDARRQQLLYALDEQVRRYEAEGKVTKYEHWEFLSAVLDSQGICRGICAQDLRSMQVPSTCSTPFPFHFVPQAPEAVAPSYLAPTGRSERYPQLRWRARHDGLTGLLNRRAMQEAIDEQLQRSRRAGDTFAVVMVDIDHFKSINDRHGHPAGDEVLVQLARLLMDQSRDSDVVCRLGGDEIAVLLPGCAYSTAVARAARKSATVARGEPRQAMSKCLAYFEDGPSSSTAFHHALSFVATPTWFGTVSRTWLMPLSRSAAQNAS